MDGLTRSALLLALTLALGCTREASTLAPPDAPRLHEADPGAGASGPDLHSKNVKLLANVARSNTAIQSDLAFAGRYAYAGNYEGFRIINIADPEHPVVVSDFHCHGAQGDVSVYDGLLFQSVDQPQTGPECDSEIANEGASQVGMFEGIRIFDVRNPAQPVHIASVPTDCGSHTHTLVPDPANGRVLLYVSSYPGALGSFGPNCDAPHGYISIVHVPLADPTAATVSKYHLDGGTELARIGFAQSQACHDVAVFVELRRAAASCMSENQLWDISDPANPRFLWRFDQPVVNNTRNDIWHSAAFSWDGRIVAFGDESGGGAAERCTDPTDQQGRIWFVDVATGNLRGSYKIPRPTTTDCTAHYFNFVPLPKGRKMLVSAWYTGGTSIVDVDRLLTGASPASAEVGFYRPSGASTWSSYWYNGFIYTNDIFRGVDAMLLSDNSRSGAAKVLPHLNPQTQEQVIR
jgi:hypothetical protein